MREGEEGEEGEEASEPTSFHCAIDMGRRSLRLTRSPHSRQYSSVSASSSSAVAKLESTLRRKAVVSSRAAAGLARSRWPHCSADHFCRPCTSRASARRKSNCSSGSTAIGILLTSDSTFRTVPGLRADEPCARIAAIASGGRSSSSSSAFDLSVALY